LSHDRTLVEHYDTIIRQEKFGFLESLILTRCVDPKNWHGLRMKLLLRSELNASSSGLSLDFSHVVELRLGNLNGIPYCRLEIQYIEDWQLENIKFKVTEPENGGFSFLCKSFTLSHEPKHP
jgi:hypothetical protein